jgi:hypothetical protein
MPNTTAEARIRISLQAGELEVEGSETFIAQYQDVLDALIDRVRTSKPGPAQTDPAGTTTSTGASAAKGDFPEALHGLPSGASGSDQILVAGYFASLGIPDSTFATGDANKLLLEQGIKLSNPSQSLRNNLTAKRVFKVGNRFRISKTGEDHLKTLISL